MKRRHASKVNWIPSKKKEMLKFLNSPNALEKLVKLGNIATTMNNTQKMISEEQYNTIEDWSMYSLTRMSPELLEKTKQNGFQQEFSDLIAKYSSSGETKDDITEQTK